MDEAFVVRGDEALSFTTTPTDQLRFLCAGGPNMPDVEDERLAPGDGPPLHRHKWATWSIVIEGTFLIRIGDDDHNVGPGDLIFTPPDVIHTFACTGEIDGRLIHFNWPGGFHHLYAELAEAFKGDGPPDFGAMAEAATRHNAEILGPPLSMTTQAE